MIWGTLVGKHFIYFGLKTGIDGSDVGKSLGKGLHAAVGSADFGDFFRGFSRICQNHQAQQLRLSRSPVGNMPHWCSHKRT